MSSASTAFASGLCVSAPARTRGSAWAGRGDTVRAARRGSSELRGILPGAFDRAR